MKHNKNKVELDVNQTKFKIECAPNQNIINVKCALDQNNNIKSTPLQNKSYNARGQIKT